jgi:hypothetical protein
MSSPFINLLATTLEDSRLEVAASVATLTDFDAKRNPPSGWSALEVLEHLTIVEDRFLGRVAEGEQFETPQVDHEKEGKLTGMILDRSTRVQAPEAVQPTGKFKTLVEALAAFDAARERTQHVVRTRGDELYSVKVTHPRFGELNGVELLHLMSGHARRHADQIREARGQLGL